MEFSFLAAKVEKKMYQISLSVYEHNQLNLICLRKQEFVIYKRDTSKEEACASIAYEMNEGSIFENDCCASS